MQYIEDITALTREYFSIREEKFYISKRLCDVLLIIETPMKYQTIPLQFFFSAKGLTYCVTIATVIFSLRAKAHLVFRWCLQLFRERLSEKVHATIPKGIVGGFEITVLDRSFERMAREAIDYVSEC